MQNSRMTFGQTVHKARKEGGYKLGQVAALIAKEDGEPITHQYLSDIENDRRTPSDHVIEQLATILNIPVVDLYLKAKRFPSYFDINDEKQAAAARAMLSKLEEIRKIREEAA